MKLRTKKLKIGLDNKKIGRELTRALSLPKVKVPIPKLQRSTTFLRSYYYKGKKYESWLPIKERSKSFVIANYKKPAIDDLYEEPKPLNLLDKLKSTMSVQSPRSPTMNNAPMLKLAMPSRDNRRRQNDNSARKTKNTSKDKKERSKPKSKVSSSQVQKATEQLPEGIKIDQTITSGDIKSE